MSNAIETAAKALAPAIAEAANRAIDGSPGLDAGDAGQIAADVTKEVAAVVVNQTNSEPWYQSAVTIGALITLAASTYALGYQIAKIGFPTPEEFTVSVTPIVGAFVTLWGRWVNKKPLGA